jgi:hypothetical protein
MDVTLEGDQGFRESEAFTNATVISYYDTEFNWTRYSIVQNGLSGFMTPLPASNQNMTTSILNGTVTVTIASEVFEEEGNNAINFVNWYVSIVTGQSDWGLPDFMVWIVRIFSFMTLLSALLIGSELLP